MLFELKTDLPRITQLEIDRVQTIPSGQRNSTETAFLNALAPYLTNELLEVDADGLILKAAGNTLPTEYTGFKKGATFIKKDASGNGVYNNIGDEDEADWDLVDSASTSNIEDGAVTTEKLDDALDFEDVDVVNLGVEEGTPVNAVAASQILTLTGVIVPGTHAVSVLTSDATAPEEDDTVTIGETVYTFKAALSGTPTAYEVLIGASAATALDNLQSAINASAGAGTTYGTGTVAHPTVVATTNTNTEQTVVARVPGTAANSTATTEASDHLSWADITLGGGTGASDAGVAPETVTIDSVVYSFVDVLSETNGASAIANQVLFGENSAAALDNLSLAINAGDTAGTNYSTGTVAHPTVNATTNSDTEQTVVADTKGVAGNELEVSATLSNGAWGDTELAGGVDGTVGKAGKILKDSSYLYIAVSANTIADANWRRVSLGSAY